VTGLPGYGPTFICRTILSSLTAVLVMGLALLKVPSGDPSQQVHLETRSCPLASAHLGSSVRPKIV